MNLRRQTLFALRPDPNTHSCGLDTSSSEPYAHTCSVPSAPCCAEFAQTSPEMVMFGELVQE